MAAQPHGSSSAPSTFANTSATLGGTGTDDIVDFATVRAAELEQIRLRREKRGIQAEKVSENLVGLALSGGGIRSAAVGLGLLQALYRRGVLKFVDYLSTVSGGGFAGAFLSSTALRSRGTRTGQAGGGAAGELPIAAALNDPQPPRMLDFIHSGRYLGRAWGFFNRYAIGLLLIWTVIVSGLLAASSFIAWGFRSLDWPEVRETLETLGFEGDVQLAFFPSFVLFALWIVLWGISYWKYVTRATGKFAQFVFVVLILVTLVAIAALTGNGDIAPHTTFTLPPGETGSSTWNAFGKMFQTVVFSAIIAGILPYLTPKKLFRSGAAPDSRPVERFVFWFATRALVFGIPFLFISLFARENISEWNELRDDRIERMEVLDWRALNSDNGKNKLIWGTTQLPKDFAARFAMIEAQLIEQHRYETADATGKVLDDLKRKNAIVTRHISFGKRWWHFAEYLLLQMGGDGREAKETQFGKEVSIRKSIREAREEIVAQLNRRLADPNYGDHLRDLKPKYKEAVDAARKEISQLPGSVPVPATGDRFGEPSMKDIQVEARTRDVIKSNRTLVETCFPGTFRPRQGTVFSAVVLEADQAERWSWFTWSGTIFLVSGLLVGLNATSWHGYYADQVSRMWIDEVDGAGRDIPLAQLDTCEAGFPYHLISATVHLFGRRDDRRAYGTRGAFLFSHLYCGAACLRAFRRTSQWMEGKYTLADATAVSGGAVSPVETRNPLLLVLLFLGNIRMGQWVENPSFRTDRSRWWYRFLRYWPVSPLRALMGVFLPVAQRPHCFTADGGHHENLGIEALLHRRCRLIVACDASSDEQYQFNDLNRLITRMRLYHGVTFTPLAEEEATPLLDGLMPDKETKLSKAHFLIAKINYPESEHRPDSYLVYAKSTVTAGTPEELRRYAQQNSPFPHDSTADQFYSPSRFEAYRQLGEQLGTVMCERLPAELPVDDAEGLIAAFAGKVEKPAAQEAALAPVAASTPAAAGVTPVEASPPDEVGRLLERLKVTAPSGRTRDETILDLENHVRSADRIIPALFDSLEDADRVLVRLCQNVLETLLRLSPSRYLLWGLRHSSATVRQQAAELFAELVPDYQEVDPEVVDAAASLLSDPNVDRQTAIDGLKAYCKRFQAKPEHKSAVRRVRKVLAETGPQRS